MYRFSIIKVVPFLIVALLLSSSIVVKAEGLFFQPRVIAGLMHYKYQESHYENIMSDDLPFFGAGITLAHDRFFLDSYFQQSATGEDDNVKPIETSAVPNLIDRDFSRKDYVFTLGYALTDNLSIFTGYKYGKTKIDLFFPLIKKGTLSTTDANFETKGPFIGASYGWLIGGGLLATNFAISKLNGEESFDLREGEVNYHETATGSTIGFTLGVSWKASLTKHFTYNISLDAYKYSFDVDNAHGRDNTTGKITELPNYGNLEEEMLSVKMNFIYRF